MGEEKIQTATGISVLNLTKYLMNSKNLSQEKAFKKLLSTELYKLIIDSETNLYLEADDYLIKCLEIEFKDGTNALKEFITRE